MSPGPLGKVSKRQMGASEKAAEGKAQLEGVAKLANELQPTGSTLSTMQVHTKVKTCHVLSHTEDTYWATTFVKISWLAVLVIHMYLVIPDMTQGGNCSSPICALQHREEPNSSTGATAVWALSWSSIMPCARDAVHGWQHAHPAFSAHDEPPFARTICRDAQSTIWLHPGAHARELLTGSAEESQQPGLPKCRHRPLWQSSGVNMQSTNYPFQCVCRFHFY